MCSSDRLSVEESYINGGFLVIVDSIGVNPLLGISGMNASSISALRSKCEDQLTQIAEIITREHAIDIISDSESFGIGPFCIPLGALPPAQVKFSLKAPTTTQNCLRVLRALQLNKPVLLEGSPGVGKSSLICNLAAVSGRSMVRINLSEQTDLSDLFGADLPVEGDSNGPDFAWRDGPFLQAMKNGDWVLLDELNLASQQVLEGLNACLDHRTTVYIPELQREFKCSPEFRVFAAQNPQSQGGGRKGLPKSFMNRFTQVFVMALSCDDLHYIVSSLHPRLHPELSRKMINFVNQIHHQVESRSFGLIGGPWEFNLRDVLRWVELVEANCDSDIISDPAIPGLFLNMIFILRMRTDEDRRCVTLIFEDIFGFLPADINLYPTVRISEKLFTVGTASITRSSVPSYSRQTHQLLHHSARILESMIHAVNLNWMVLLTGPTAIGKSTLVKTLASISGNILQEFAMNEGVDTIEMLGGFEQADLVRRRQQILRKN